MCLCLYAFEYSVVSCVLVCVCLYVCVGSTGEKPLIAAHICVSSWALEVPVQPVSPHQKHSLGLSVNTNAKEQRLSEVASHIRRTNAQKHNSNG